MQQTSLGIFGTENLSIKRKEIVFGGITRIVDGKKLPPPGFLPLSFKDLVINLDKHFLEWYKMFDNILTTISSTSDQLFQKYYNFLGYSIDKISRQ